MKKKFLSIWLVLACLCLSFGLAACNGGGSNYMVTVKGGTGYTVQGISADGYKEGAEVAFKVEVTDDTKQLKEVSAGDEVLTVDEDGYYKFTMPAKSVEISVTLESKTFALELSSTSLVLNAQTDESASVTVAVKPDGDTHELEWKTGNAEIATVTANGKTAEITAVAKGKTTISVSLKGIEGVEASEIAVSVIDARPWTEDEENAMKDHLHGIVLFPAEQEEMQARWDANPGQITVEGDLVEGDELAEYAGLYTADNDWVDVTSLYSVEPGTAYMFEKAVEISDGTRYVRVFIYAATDQTGEHLSQEGVFYITAYDPYVYEWPAAYLAAATKELLSTDVIPSVSAPYYFIYNYSVTAYYESSEKDGGYGAALTAAGYTVEEQDGYYRAVSPDKMFSLTYIYKDGALEITVRYNITTDWSQSAIANAFNYYSELELDVAAFTLPAFDGDDVSFMFSDGYYNKFWINEGKARDMYGTITVYDSTLDLTEAYTQKLVNNGWTKLGTDGTYIKQIAESEKVNRIKISYSSENDSTLIEFYYFSIQDPTRWSNNVIRENNLFYKYKTDVLPEYTGTIVSFIADKDTVYLTVPEADFAGLLDAYKQILVDAGYVLEGASTWTQQYFSPNRQFGLKLSTPSSKPNTIQIFFSSEMPSAWNNERIKDTLPRIGSSLESIPEFESETSFLCTYEIKKDYSTTPSKDYLKLTLTASDSEQSLTQADADAYKAKLVTAGWTLDGSKYVASDGKTSISVSFSSGSVTIEIKYTA